MVIDEDRSSSQIVKTITSYDVSGDSLDKQWETEVNTNPNDIGMVGYQHWGNYITISGYIVDTATGEQAPWPWPIDASPDFIDNYAVNCDDADQCTAWDSEHPHQVLWTKTIPGVEERYFLWQLHWEGSIYRQNGVTIVRFGDYTLVNLATGETYPIDVPPSKYDNTSNQMSEYDSPQVDSLSEC